MLVAWGIASLGIGAISLSEVFLAKNTFHAGDFGYGLLFGAIGTGLVIGSLSSSSIVERLGIGTRLQRRARADGESASAPRRRPNIWVAAVCCVVGGIGDGVAIVCNALLVQRGASTRARPCADARDERDVRADRRRQPRGRLAPPRHGSRWVWGGAGGALLVAASPARSIARNLGGETAAAGEHRGAGPRRRRH